MAMKTCRHKKRSGRGMDGSITAFTVGRALLTATTAHQPLWNRSSAKLRGNANWTGTTVDQVIHWNLSLSLFLCVCKREGERGRGERGRDVWVSHRPWHM